MSDRFRQYRHGARPTIPEYQMNRLKECSEGQPRSGAIGIAALLFTSLLLLAGCSDGGTQDQTLLDHSGARPDSIYRHHHNTH